MTSYSSDTRTIGRQADTVELLFDKIAPPLLEEGNWVYVPNLEGNIQWVKEALVLANFFSIDDARVVLSDKMVGGVRVHSVVKMFKKYGTQSAICTLKILKRGGGSLSR